MSSIAITGGATGTGVFSLLAPSTSTNRTLTLPDSTGTVVATGSTAVVTPAMLTQPLTSGTAVASTSGTSIDFTGIPSWAKRITVLFSGVSTNGSSDILIRTGSGSISSINYSSVLAYWANGGTAVVATNSTGFRASATSPSQTFSGAMVIALVNSATNVWTETASFSDGTTYLVTGSGSNILGGVLDRVRITTVNGTDTFDAGLINILWE